MAALSVWRSAAQNIGMGLHYTFVFDNYVLSLFLYIFILREATNDCILTKQLFSESKKHNFLEPVFKFENMFNPNKLNLK